MSAKTQVLVVDDEAAILRFLKPALEANGYEMTSAGSVAEATKRIAAENHERLTRRHHIAHIARRTREPISREPRTIGHGVRNRHRKAQPARRAQHVVP